MQPPFFVAMRNYFFKKILVAIALIQLVFEICRSQARFACCGSEGIGRLGFRGGGRQAIGRQSWCHSSCAVITLICEVVAASESVIHSFMLSA